MPSQKVLTDMTQGGGRHYKGRDRFRPTPWVCPACQAPNTGRLEDGCPSCGAGKPGMVVKRPGAAAEPKIDHYGAAPSLSEQLARRRQATAAPAAPGLADEIVSRIETLLEEKLGGTSYTQEERAVLFAGLESLIWLWENGEIEPTFSLTLEQTKALALRVAPGTLPEPLDYTTHDEEPADVQQPDADPDPPDSEGPPDQ